LSAREHHWDALYRRQAPTRVSWYQDSPTLSLALIERTGIARAARLVDVGGGASVLVDRLLERGFANVSVLDVASAALAAAKARLGERAQRVEWVVADVTAWRPPGLYDLWHDRAVFHFLVEESDRRAYVATLRAALAPGGHVIIATFALDGPERCSGLPVMRYSADGLAGELGADFRLIESAPETHVTPAGVEQRFLYARFTRR
jgi:2-polyprenyl-3-methyl-5-hydroxy-6-metoxy-1,4-benzoquinol methylase